MKNNKGFSLIELIVVVAIMAIMGSFIFFSFGLLTGQDARKCANNLSTVLDKEKNYALTKSAETDCCVEIESTADGYRAKYYVPQKAIGAGTNMMEEEEIGKPSVTIRCYYDDNFEDASVGDYKSTLAVSDILTITYDRVSGAVKEIKLNGSTENINKIQIEKGRTYEIRLFTATGKHTMERTD